MQDPAPTPVETEAGALTPGEAEVCAKVAEGLSNQEIADQLFVSVKAVEFHVHNAFLKLGATNRVQLAVSYLHHIGDLVDD